MEKDVIVSVSGLSDPEDENSPVVETTSPGTYYCKNNKEYIVYTEYMDQKEGVVPTRSTIRLEKDQIILSRIGDVAGQMVFSLGRHHLVYYNTPFGAMEIRILTKTLEIKRDDHQIHLLIKYEMAINDQPHGAQTVEIRVYDRYSHEG